MKRYSQWTNNNKIDEAIISSKNDKLVIEEIPDNYFELSDIIEEKVQEAYEKELDVLDLSGIEVKKIKNFYRERDRHVYTIFDILKDKKYKNIKIIDVSYWDLQSIKNLDYIFCDLEYIEKIIGLDTWKIPTTVKSARYTFSQCHELREIKMFSTTFIEELAACFLDCHQLREIPEMDLSNCRSAARMFSSCYRIKVCPEFNIKKCSFFYSMFAYCSRLKKVPALEIDYVDNMEEMFKDCESLYTIPFFKIKSIKKSLSTTDIFEHCDNLDIGDYERPRDFGDYWIQNSLVK